MVLHLDELIKLLIRWERSYQNKDNLELTSFSNVYAIGACASIPNPFSGKPYPSTTQHN